MNFLSKTILVWVFITIIGVNWASSQNSDQDKARIKEIATKSIKLTFREHKDLRLVISSVFITFDKDSKIEDVLFSETINGLLKSKEKTTDDLKTEINELKLDKKSFSNSYIIAIVIVGYSERVSSANTEMPENWDKLFASIDIKKLRKKNLKYCFSIGYEYLGSITD
jgi:hypothetical protein